MILLAWASLIVPCPWSRESLGGGGGVTSKMILLAWASLTVPCPWSRARVSGGGGDIQKDTISLGVCHCSLSMVPRGSRGGGGGGDIQNDTISLGVCHCSLFMGPSVSGGGGVTSKRILLAWASVTVPCSWAPRVSLRLWLGRRLF